MSDVERFFRSKDIKIVKVENEYNEMAETAAIDIYFDKNDRSVSREFMTLIMRELNTREDINRSFEVLISVKKIVIYPESEKTYITASFI